MSMRDLEMAVVNEAKQVLGNDKLRLKDLMEWSTGKVEPQENETLVYLPTLKVNASFKIPEPKGKKAGK
jgi:hypothetical protein